jgi:hypothetical protein
MIDLRYTTGSMHYCLLRSMMNGPSCNQNMRLCLLKIVDCQPYLYCGLGLQSDICGILKFHVRLNCIFAVSTFDDGGRAPWTFDT